MNDILRSSFTWLALTIVAGIVVYFVSNVLGIGELLYKLPFVSPISVSPNKIDLKDNSFNTKSKFKIFNRTKNPLYDIYVKLSLNDLQHSQVEIKTDSPENIQESLGFNDALRVVADYDIIKVNGIDSKGREAIYLILYNLDPQQPRSFTIKVFRDNKISKPSNIKIKPLKWSDKPKEVYSSGNQIAFPFSFPENFVLNNISMIMFRNQ